MRLVQCGVAVHLTLRGNEDTRSHHSVSLKWSGSSRCRCPAVHQSQLDPGCATCLGPHGHCPFARLPAGRKQQCPSCLVEPTVDNMPNNRLSPVLPCTLSTLVQAQDAPHLTGKETALTRHETEHQRYPKALVLLSLRKLGAGPGDPEKNRVHRTRSCTTSQLKAARPLNREL